VRSERTRLLVEIALTVALSAVLSMLAVRLPINFAGGTISLSMVPILVLALRRGVFPGVIAGALFGCVDFLIEPFVVAPAQVLLDYPIAYGLVGLAGLGSGVYRRTFAVSPARATVWVVVFGLVGAAGRLAAAWASGMVFFAANAPAGQPVWLYSLVYNLSYLVPSTVICIAVAAVALPAIELALPTSARPAGTSA